MREREKEREGEDRERGRQRDRERGDRERGRQRGGGRHRERKTERQREGWGRERERERKTERQRKEEKQTGRRNKIAEQTEPMKPQPSRSAVQRKPVLAVIRCLRFSQSSFQPTARRLERPEKGDIDWYRLMLVETVAADDEAADADTAAAVAVAGIRATICSWPVTVAEVKETQVGRDIWQCDRAPTSL